MLVVCVLMCIHSRETLTFAGCHVVMATVTSKHLPRGRSLTVPYNFYILQ